MIKLAKIDTKNLIKKNICKKKLHDTIANKIIKADSSVRKLNIGLINRLLVNGIINNDSVYNTINFAIKNILLNSQESIDIELIKNLIFNGAVINNGNQYNTLSLTLNSTIQYFFNSYNPQRAEKNILELIKFLIDKGAKLDNSNNNPHYFQRFLLIDSAWHFNIF